VFSRTLCGAFGANVTPYPQEGRRRGLALRTYAVIPLTEITGLLEWVPDTATFRSIAEAQQVRFVCVCVCVCML
jgi:hypothetical protein